MTAVTVVVNNHGYERFVGAAIRSALEQTAPAQVVVVDDGSTDGSRDVIGAFGDAVGAVYKPQGGQTSALNAAYPHARGDVVIFLDADDLLYPSAVEQAAEAC